MKVNSVPTQMKERWTKSDVDAEKTSKLTVSLC